VDPSWLLLAAAAGFVVGAVVAHLATVGLQHAMQPDPQTTVRWSDFEVGGGTATPTIPTVPAPLHGSRP
jgi:hypothetical protein